MYQNGGQNGFQRQPGSKSVLEGAQARFWLDFDLILVSILAHFWTSGTPKNNALAVARCHFRRK